MKNVYKYALIASAVFSFAACNNLVEPSEPAVDIERTTLIATREGTDPNTRSVRMEDGATWWGPKEDISVFYGSGTNGGSMFTSNNTTLAETTEFEGSISMSGSKDFWAVYPYSSEISCDGSSVVTVIPSQQTGSEGNFADDAFPAIGKSGSLTMPFWNICGGIKFFVSRTDIQSVTIKGNNGEPLAGKVRVAFDADGHPEVTEIIEGKTEVTLVAPEGGCFKPGKYYYATLLPTALDGGITLTFYTSSEKGEIVSDNAQTIKRSIFGVLKNVDSKVAEWESSVAVDVDLSNEGTGNCYIVSMPGSYKFKAVKGNDSEAISGIKGVKVLWESFGTTEKPKAGDLIDPSITFDGEYVCFRTGGTFHEGNAVIAAFSDSACSEGNVLWSWHLWFTDTPSNQVYANGAGTMMDRNLGATSATPGDVGSYGLLYEWGRKDPFMASGTHPASGISAASTGEWPGIVASDANTGTIAYSISHPMTYIVDYEKRKDWIYGGSTDEDKWNGTENGTYKTIYDPCPPGWHVPDINVWKKAGFVDHEFVPYDAVNGGVLFPASICGSDSWFPCTGVYIRNDELDNFKYGFLWASSSYDYWGESYYFTIMDDPENAFSCAGYFEKFCLLPVRCCQNVIKIEYNLSLEEKFICIPAGGSAQLHAVMTPDNPGTNVFTWKSYNTSVATVSADGVVTGVSEGQTNIGVTSSDGQYKSCLVLVGDYPGGNIDFQDEVCKSLCVNKWDMDGDGELSYAEAALVTSLSGTFYHYRITERITSFNEFQYFVNCKELKAYVHGPKGDKEAEGVFEGQNELVSITLPPGLETIGELCFSECSSLTAIEIPETVSSLGFGCFSYCTGLQRITVKATVPPTISFYDTWYEEYKSDPETFDRVPGNIYVPAASLSAYKSARGWELYSDKIFAEE